MIMYLRKLLITSPFLTGFAITLLFALPFIVVYWGITRLTASHNTLPSVLSSPTAIITTTQSISTTLPLTLSQQITVTPLPLFTTPLPQQTIIATPPFVPPSQPYPMHTVAPPQPATPPTSNGIGIERVQWEKTHGSPNNYDGLFYYYENKSYALNYTQNDEITILKRIWSERDAMPLDEARNIATRFMPTDSQKRNTIQPHITTVVDVYHSAWLEQRFAGAATQWHDGLPGDFIVLYDMLDTDKVVSFTVQPGVSQGQ